MNVSSRLRKQIVSAIRPALVFLIVGLCHSSLPVWAEDTGSPKSALMADSAPGWAPSEAEAHNAIEAVFNYYGALNDRAYQQAYDMYTEALRAQLPFEIFVAASQKRNSEWGIVEHMKPTMITWGKNPTAAPLPGTYAAVDLIARFTGADRHCGYVVLYKPEAASEFRVMRVEDNVIDNAAAAKIMAEQSAEALEAASTRLSARCPNYGTP